MAKAATARAQDRQACGLDGAVHRLLAACFTAPDLSACAGAGLRRHPQPATAHSRSSVARRGARSDTALHQLLSRAQPQSMEQPPDFAALAPSARRHLQSNRAGDHWDR